MNVHPLKQLLEAKNSGIKTHIQVTFEKLFTTLTPTKHLSFRIKMLVLCQNFTPCR